MSVFLSAIAPTEKNDMAIAGFGEVAEQLRRSTVLIHAGGRGSGSGVIWTSDGTVVTNAHVVRGSNTRVQLWDGREFDAAVTARDPQRDLATLRIGANLLPATSPADSSQLRPGVIGINTMVAGRLALAIPSNAVLDFLAGGPRSAWLGVTVHPARLPRANGYAFGLVLLEVEPGSPAAQASLMAGDILLGTEEKRFQSIEDLARAIDGQGLRLLRFEFLRGDYSRVQRVTVQLGVSNDGKDRLAA